MRQISLDDGLANSIPPEDPRLYRDPSPLWPGDEHKGLTPRRRGGTARHGRWASAWSQVTRVTSSAQLRPEQRFHRTASGAVAIHVQQMAGQFSGGAGHALSKRTNLCSAAAPFGYTRVKSMPMRKVHGCPRSARTAAHTVPASGCPPIDATTAAVRCALKSLHRVALNSDRSIQRRLPQPKAQPTAVR